MHFWHIPKTEPTIVAILVINVFDRQVVVSPLDTDTEIIVIIINMMMASPLVRAQIG